MRRADEGIPDERIRGRFTKPIARPEKHRLVKAGNTASIIAQHELSNTLRWEEILEVEHRTPECANPS